MERKHIKENNRKYIAPINELIKALAKENIPFDVVPITTTNNVKINEDMIEEYELTSLQVIVPSIEERWLDAVCNNCTEIKENGIEILSEVGWQNQIDPFENIRCAWSTEGAVDLIKSVIYMMTEEKENA